MPQNSQNLIATNPSGASSALSVDGARILLTGQGGQLRKNITAATVVKASAGRVARVVVLVAGSATGTVNDLATTSGAAVANQVFTIPDALGSYEVDVPTSVGILVVPGTGQTLAVSFS